AIALIGGLAARGLLGGEGGGRRLRPQPKARKQQQRRRDEPACFHDSMLLAGRGGLAIHRRLGPFYHRSGQGPHPRQQLLDLAGIGRVDLEIGALRIGEQRRVLQARREGAAQDGGALGRHAGGRHIGPAENVAGQQQLERFALDLVARERGRERYLGQV